MKGNTEAMRNNTAEMTMGGIGGGNVGQEVFGE